MSREHERDDAGRVRAAEQVAARGPVRRVAQFLLGLALCSTGVWLSLRAHLGLSPWDVLHAGVSARSGLSFGVVVMAVGVLVLVVSALLRVRPGLGTVVNVVLVGVALDGLLASPWLRDLPQAPIGVRVAVLLAAVALLGVGAALYLGAGFGAGPRDGLMVACHHRGLPLGWSRCVLEVSVLGVGWLLGGPVGLGTLVVALGTGPAVQGAFALLRQRPPPACPPSARRDARRRTAGRPRRAQPDGEAAVRRGVGVGARV